MYLIFNFTLEKYYIDSLYPVSSSSHKCINTDKFNQGESFRP